MYTNTNYMYMLMPNCQSKDNEKHNSVHLTSATDVPDSGSTG